MSVLRKELKATTAIALVSILAGGLYAPSAIAQDTDNTPQQNTPQEEEDFEEIIVTGQRGSVINSIQEKRNSEGIADILSADQADRFPDPNIAEGLARIPGVSFQRQNDTGDGQFISIRGLDAGLNSVLFDGLRAGAADGGGGRRTPLDIITGSNVSSIKVSKSLLPEDPSEGIGGAVDIRTRGPLERSDSLGFTVAGIQNSFEDRTGFRASGRWNKKFSDSFGVNISAQYRKRFFSNVALDPTTTPDLVTPVLLTGANGTNGVFLDSDDLALVPVGFVPDTAFTHEQLNYRFDDIERENISISGAIDWKPAEHTTLTIGGRYTRVNITNTESEIEFDSDDTGEFFVPGQSDIVDGDDLLETLFGTNDISGLSTAELQSGLAGVTAFFDDQEAVFEGEIQDEVETQERIFFRGETNLDQWEFNYVIGYSRAFEDSPDLDFEFDQEVVDLPAFDALVAANPGLSAAFIENANGFSPGDLSDPIFPSVAPQNAALFAQLIDPTTGVADLEDANLELVNSVENERWSARFDTAYNFDSGALEYVKAGIQWERSEFTDIFIDIDGFFDDFVEDQGIAAADIFIPGEIASFDDIGSPFANIGFNGIPLANRAFLDQLKDATLAAFEASGETPDFAETLEATERFYSGYVQGKAVFGKLDVIGGIRFEFYDADFLAPSSVAFAVEGEDALGEAFAIDLAQAEALQVANAVDNFEVLPRLALNYNLSDQTKIRFGFSTALARPEFSTLAADIDSEITLELNNGVDIANATLADVATFDVNIETGNPNLVNAYAYNFDLSFEHYFDDQNAISIAAFYKSIDNFIFQAPGLDGEIQSELQGLNVPNVDAILVSTPLSDQGQALVDQLGGFEALIGIVNDFNLDQPQNGGRAEVYGIELGVFHTLTYLPGFLSNLGFIGNITLQQTSTDIQLGTFSDDSALVVIGDAVEGDAFVDSFEFFNSPNLTYNAALFYDDDSFEATLAYRFAGSQFEAAELRGLSQFQRSRGFLDFDIEYNLPDSFFDGRAQIFFSVRDLTDGGSKFEVSEASASPSSILNNLSTFNGRTFTFGTRVRF